MLKIKGIGVVNATPLAKDDKVNEEEYRKHINWLAECGIGFVQPCAATGQAMQTTENEYRRILEITVEELKGKVIITAYGGRAGTADTIRMCKIAQEVGCDAAYIIQPFFTRPDAEGQYRHYKAVAEALPNFPLVFYNNPERAGAGSDISQEVMVRLVSEHDNFVGLKQSNLNSVMDNYAALQDKITVWPKSEKEILVGLAMGSPGILTFAGNIVPAELVQIVKSWQAGEFDKAREIYFKILPLINIIHIEPVPGPIKYMLNRMGWDFGDPRLPIHPVSRESAAKIDKVLRDLGKI